MRTLCSPPEGQRPCDPEHGGDDQHGAGDRDGDVDDDALFGVEVAQRAGGRERRRRGHHDQRHQHRHDRAHGRGEQREHDLVARHAETPEVLVVRA